LYKSTFVSQLKL